MDLQPHKFATLFPPMEGIAYRDLVEDIRLNGLRHPIVLFEGQILDGCNRYRACRAAQVDARFKTFSGKDPLAFVVSANLHRRHLDTSQKAMIAAEVMLLRSGARGPTTKPVIEERRALAKQLAVGAATIMAAESVLRHGSKRLVRAVRDRKVSVSGAHHASQLPKKAQDRVLRKVGSVRLWDAVSEEHQNLRQGTEPPALLGGHHAIYSWKFRDNQVIGNVLMGDIARIAQDAERELMVCRGILAHCANAEKTATVRDTIKAAVLKQIIYGEPQ
jgi:hypothetical protein